MFRNIGGKIKGLASFTAWLGIIASVIAGIVVIVATETPLGLVVIIAGFLVSWIGAFQLYGYGQMIENTDRTLLAILRMAKNLDSKQEEMQVVNRLNKLEQWKEEGLISEEEYIKQKNNILQGREAK